MKFCPVVMAEVKGVCSLGEFGRSERTASNVTLGSHSGASVEDTGSSLPFMAH